MKEIWTDMLELKCFFCCRLGLRKVRQDKDLVLCLAGYCELPKVHRFMPFLVVIS